MAFGAVFTIGAWEWAAFGALRGTAARLAYAAGMALLLGAAWRWTDAPAHLLLLLAIACAWWVIALLWLSLAPARHHAALALACGLPVLVPAFIALARLQVATGGYARGPQAVLWLVLLVIAADVGAYFAGRSLGRRKLAPRVSPGKTSEGALGGLLLVALVAWCGAAHFGLSPRGGRDIWLRGGHFFNHRRSNREHVQTFRRAQRQRHTVAGTRRSAGSHR